MCESHVSNPQTVGKCCSLLNSLLPPSLLPSTPPSVALSFGWTALQTSNLPCCSLMRVCVHASARVCLPFSTQEVSAERLPARLRLEPPLPADSFYANTKSFTTHRRTHTHRQPLRLPVKNNKDTPSRREAAPCLLFSVCLSLYPVCLFLFNTNADIFSICVLCVSIPSCDSSQFVSYDCQQDSSLT